MHNADTICLGLLGSPVYHSQSPLMHNAVFARLGINAVYLPFQVAPGKLSEAVTGLAALGFKGANVTIPFKEEVVPLLNRLSPEAELYQAVNVVANENGELVGYNTDGPGFLMAVREAGVANIDRCLLLGAGGAARSISLALAGAGAREVTILDVDQEKAAGLARYITDHSSITGCGLLADRHNWEQVSPTADLIVNCTPVGMYPRTEESPVVSLKGVSSSAVVCDIIYNPLETKLLAMARQSGLITVNGLAMFVHQGALTLKILLGIDAPVEFMKDVVAGGLQSPGSNPD